MCFYTNPSEHHMFQMLQEVSPAEVEVPYKLLQVEQQAHNAQIFTVLTSDCMFSSG